MAYCVFFFVSATKLNKSLFLFQHSVVNDGETPVGSVVDIIFADDSTLLSDQAYQKYVCVRAIFKNMGWKWVNKLVSKHSCSRLGDKTGKKGGEIFEPTSRAA